MRKDFILTALLLIIVLGITAQPWSYDFGTGTGVYSTNGASTTFLPTAPSGTARVRCGSGGGSHNMENPGLTGLGTATELRIVAPTGTSVNKYSIYDYTAGKTFFTKFDILLGNSTGGNASSGTFIFTIGDGAQYSDNNAFAGAQVFTGMQWVFGASGAITTTYRNGGSWSTLGSTPFSQGTVYTVEIYGNNTTSSASYDRSSTSYTLAANKQDIWVNGSLIGDDLAKAALPNDANIDSFLFYGLSSTGNVANCFLDNFTYSNALPVGGVSAPTTQASSITFSSVQQNQMTVGWTNGNGAKRIVIMNTSNSFTNPTDGTDPTANTTYGGSGEQVVYNNSGNSVIVNGLTASTTYWYRVYEYNGSGTSTKYLTSTATDNPKSQQTAAPSPTITTGAVTTPPFYVDSATTAAGSVAFTSTGTYSSATFTAKLSDATGSFASPTSIGTTVVNGTDPSGSISITIPAGTAEGAGYKVRIDCASPAITGTESSAFSVQNGAKDVTGVNSSVGSGTLTVSWTNPTSIYDEIMIVTKATSTITGTPSGNGSAYSPSLTYGSGTGFDSGFVVYKGALSPQTITNLTNGTVYYVKLFTRKNSNWSAGVEINNTPATPPSLAEIIIPQYIQGLNGTNNQRLPYACRLSLDNLIPSATYRYFGMFVEAADGPTVNGAGVGLFVNSDDTFTRSTSLSMGTSGQYSEFTTDGSGSYTGWFMGEPSGNARFTPGNNVWYRVMLNNGSNGTSVITRLTTSSSIKVINFGTQDNVNQGTFLWGESLSPAKNFVFVYDNESGTGRPIAGTVIESDGLDLSGVTQILPAYKTNVDGVAGAWGLIIPNSTGVKGFTGILRVESRRYDDGTVYSIATDSDGVWPSGADTTDPTGGDDTPIYLDEDDATLPVELSSFTATISAQNYVNVMWVTQSETNVNGFYIHRGVSNDLGEASIISQMINATNTSQLQVYQYTDSEIYDTGTYYYWLEVQEMDGGMAYHGPTVVFFDNGGNPAIPDIHYPTEIRSIYPNPFNPHTTIQYSLSKQADVSFVIYNARGQIVRSISEGSKNGGSHQVRWNGKDDNGSECGTGIYYVKMQAGKDSFLKKAVLVK